MYGRLQYVVYAPSECVITTEIRWAVAFVRERGHAHELSSVVHQHISSERICNTLTHSHPYSSRPQHMIVSVCVSDTMQYISSAYLFTTFRRARTHD